MSYLNRYFICLFVTFVFAGALFQSSKVLAEPPSPWNVRCAEVEGKNLCEMVQRISVAKTGQRVAEFSIGSPDEGGTSKAVIMLPLGILVQEKVIMKIDDNKPVSFKIKYCVPGGCLSNLTLKKTVIDNLKRGNKVLVTARGAANQPINIEMSLKGFTKNYKSL